MADQTTPCEPSWRDGLTPRQIKVCELVAKGYTNKEIGRSLGISSRTVEDHKGIAMGKLGVRNAVELTRVVLGIDLP